MAKQVPATSYNPPQSPNTYVPPPSPNTYIPPKDLYSFPPNIDAIYPPPGDSFKSPVYPGPLNPDAPSLSDAANGDSGDTSNNGDSMMNSPPGDADGQGNGNADANGDSSAQNDDGNANDSPSMMPMGYNYNDGPRPPFQGPQFQRPPLPPPPPPSDDDDRGPQHDHPPFLNFGQPRPSDLPFPFDPNLLKDDHGHGPYSDIIFDHDPHHDHHHHHDDHDFFDFHHHLPPPPPRPLPPPPPPPPTTEPPPPPEEPEEPEQPRVKKYSYFYLSRSLWYIPLYFTVWFTFYVTWLILQSIGRHKVDASTREHRIIRMQLTCLICFSFPNRLIYRIT